MELLYCKELYYIDEVELCNSALATRIIETLHLPCFLPFPHSLVEKIIDIIQKLYRNFFYLSH